jgi:hypothetical protein
MCSEDPCYGFSSLTDEQKLELLRSLAAEAFAEIERGHYIDVGPDELDRFIDQLDALSRQNPPQ